MVDLDGARVGQPVNLEHVRRIASELDVPVQLGGGLRTPEAISEALAAGVERVILGTAAFADPDLLERALARARARARGGVGGRARKPRDDGGMDEGSRRERRRRSSRACSTRGVRELAYTNVDRDGMLDGVRREDVVWVARAATGGHLIYSGGISGLEDLRMLAALGEPSLTGVIVGKALYEGRFTVAQARAALG